jgi:hypothetical protein
MYYILYFNLCILRQKKKGEEQLTEFQGDFNGELPFGGENIIWLIKYFVDGLY